jgi:hypothetical protein
MDAGRRSSANALGPSFASWSVRQRFDVKAGFDVQDEVRTPG